MVSPAGSSSLVGSWDPPSLQHRNGEIVRYVVNVTLTARGGVQVANGELRTLFTTVTSLTVDSLHPHYTYSFSVAAENSVGVGPNAETLVMMPEAGKECRENWEDPSAHT